MPFKDAASHTLVRIEPIDGTNWTSTRTELLSDFISRRVFEWIRLYEAVKISELIMGLLRNPDARGYGGKFFQQAVHRKFRAGFSFQPTPLTENASNLSIDILKVDEEADGYFYTLSVRAKSRSRDVHAQYLRRYLIPVSKTQESVDAVWLSVHSTAFLQITVSPDHPLKLLGITALTDELPANVKKNIYIVYVVPYGDKSTEHFKQQKIISPAGMDSNIVKEVEKYPQYVYYLDLNSVQ